MGDLIERLRTELVSANKHGDPDLADLLRDTLAALEAAREDGERYRWLRESAQISWNGYVTWEMLFSTEPERNELDAAIDQARGIVPEAGSSPPRCGSSRGYSHGAALG